MVLHDPAAIVAAENHATGLRRLYVCLTRAVTSLVVRHDDDLPPELGVERLDGTLAEAGRSQPRTDAERGLAQARLTVRRQLVPQLTHRARLPRGAPARSLNFVRHSPA